MMTRARVLLVAGLLTLGAAPASAQQGGYYEPPPDDPYAAQQAAPQYAYPPEAAPQYAYPDPSTQQAYAADAVQYGFANPHPVPYDRGGGFCYGQGGHYHDYAPFDQYLFREAGGWFYFVGDPTDFGYAQATWTFSGHHPIPAEWGGGYCFMEWAHRHPYVPAAGLAYSYVNGVYTYGGPFDSWYYTWRPRYSGYWGGYYRSNYIGGRYYVVRPPAVYRPSLVVGAPGVYRPGVRVGAPGVYVAPPRVGGGAGVYVAPPRVGGGAGVYVAPPRVSTPAPVLMRPTVVVPPPRAAVGGVRVAPPPFRR